MLADCLALIVFLTGLLGTMWKNHWFLLVSGIFLSMLTVCAHNFLHMKNNWRVYYFQLSLMSVRYFPSPLTPISTSTQSPKKKIIIIYCSFYKGMENQSRFKSSYISEFIIRFGSHYGGSLYELFT